MAKASVINMQESLSLLDIIKFQINFYCFNNKLRLSPAQLDCLSLLGLYGEINMSDFCVEVVNEEIFGNVQTTRNFITKCCKTNLVNRKGLGNKFLQINPEIKLLTSGNILLNLKLYYIEANKS
jgi:hypothetical protein